MLHYVHRCYTQVMPTNRPRHMITETDRLAGALDTAALLWPEVKSERTALLRKVVEAGIGAIEREHRSREASRRTTITALAGSMSGTWPTQWREDMRDEWPA